MDPNSEDPIAGLADAVSRVEIAKRSDKDALWIGTSGAGVALLVIAGTPAATAWWAIIVVVVAFALPYRIAKIVLYRVRGLGSLSLTGDLQPNTVSLQSKATAPVPTTGAPSPVRPRSALVPRLDFAPSVHPHEVLIAKVLVVETLRGGQPGVDFRDLPLGVFMVTQKGLAFLPAGRGKLEEIIGEIPAAALTQVASQLFEPVEFVERLHGVAELTKEPPTIAQWMDTALKQRHHFVVAWGDLTGVMVGLEHSVLSRETGPGHGEDFIILDTSPSWPEVLMQRRIVADLKEAVYAKILRPKYGELLPIVRAEMSAATAEEEISNEAARRAMAWFSTTKPDIEPVVKQAMVPALEGYSFLPEVVEKQPWLF